VNLSRFFKYTWTTEVPRSSEKIIEDIDSKKDNYTWRDVFFGRDISEVKIKDRE